MESQCSAYKSKSSGMEMAQAISLPKIGKIGLKPYPNGRPFVQPFSAKNGTPTILTLGVLPGKTVAVLCGASVCLTEREVNQKLPSPEQVWTEIDWFWTEIDLD